MTAFAAAADVIFTDPNMAADALYRAGGDDPPVPVRVLTRAPDRMTSFSEGRFLSEVTLLDVRTSQVPTLSRGDTFQIGELLLEVRAEPMRDAERLVWQAEARAL